MCALLVSIGVSETARAQPVSAPSQGWDVSVGAGILSAPNYTGDDAYQAILAPSIRATNGDHWTISFREGVQYTVNPQESWQWGLALAPSFGRDTDGDSPLRIAGKGTDDLKGLAETDTAAALRLFTLYTVSGWSINADVQQIFSSGSPSTLAVGLRRSGRVKTQGPPLIISGGIRLRAGNQQTLTSLVGVTQEESVSSALAPYRPDAGVIGVGLNAAVILPLSRSLSVVSTVSIEQLGSEIADSSLITERGDPLQTSVGVFLSYRLGAEQGRR